MFTIASILHLGFMSRFVKTLSPEIHETAPTFRPVASTLCMGLYQAVVEDSCQKRCAADSNNLRLAGSISLG